MVYFKRWLCHQRNIRVILLRLRDGRSTQDDWITLCQRTPQHVNMSDFTDALRLYFLTSSLWQSTTLRNLTI